MNVLKNRTYLQVSDADEVGSHWWQNPDCTSTGVGDCVYLGPGQPASQAYLLDARTSDGSPADPWFAADNATQAVVTANVEATTCYRGSSSCNHKGIDVSDNSTVVSHLEAVQVDRHGLACNVTQSPDRTDVIGNIPHHYNIAYTPMVVPVLSTCGGSREFIVRVFIRMVSGNPVKIDGSCCAPETPQAQTYASITNRSYTTTTTVPTVTDLSQAAAQSALTAAHLKLGTVTLVPSSRPAGTVLAQNAPAGTVEPTNAPVNLTVSALTVNQVPDFMAPVNSAFFWGFTLASGQGPVTWTATNLPPGLSLDPATGGISGAVTQYGVFPISYTATAAGQTSTGSFTITVTVPVPNLYGRTQAQAISQLAAVGLVTDAPGSLPTEILSLDGKVVSQYTAAGTQVPPGTVVSFVLGFYKPDVCGPNPC